MLTLSEAWTFIKQKTWDKFPRQQICIDENEHIIVMKRKNNKILIAGLLYSYRVYDVSYFSEILDFIKELKKRANENWIDADIVLITNFLLANISHFSHNEIIELPKDITYYCLYYKDFIKMDREESINACINSHRRYVEFHRNRAKRENEPPDYEAAIMNALSRGDADRFGF